MKLTKKILAVVLSVLFVVGVFAGCSSKDANTKDTTTKASASSDIKVGFIFLHDENSTYDKNFITAADEACKTLGIADENKIYKTNVPEGQECTEAATLLTRDAQSSLPTASVTSLTLLKLLRSILKFSSAIQQAQELIQKVLTTITMHSLQFTKADILQVLLQV